MNLPRKTEQKLNEPIAPGTRHATAVELALQLMGSGMSPSETQARLTEKFVPGLSEREVTGIIAWAKDRARPLDTNRPANQYRQFTPAPAAPKPKPPAEHAKWWLSGKAMTAEQFAERSQLPIPESGRDALILALEMLYLGTDNINIMCRFTQDEAKGKANPSGNGQTQSRVKWVEYIHAKGVPESQAGAWFRPNTCALAGSGAGGAITDADIVAWKFLLLESDVLPLETQLALFGQLKLPLAMVTLSGGHSAHALVKVEAKSQAEFADTARRILTALQPFGIDQANKNPSRLSRLPCARRVIGAEGTGIQKLLWLNPGKAAVAQDELAAFEESLLLPALDERPYRQVVMDAVDRYEYLIANKGKLGVMTGFPKLDGAMGGWKGGTMSVIAANTGVGKTTLALNWANTALRNGVGVALFSMEMSREDICDMLFSINCKVDRNHFNTGEFTENEIKSMSVAGGWMQNLPLWIEDDAVISLATVRRRVFQLAADTLIGLVVIDYAQLIDPEDKREPREQQVATISRGLRVLAKESKLPFLVLSQVNDDGLLRESRVLSHEAANVFKLMSEKRELTLYVNKGRKIPSDPVPVFFEAKYCTMGERVNVKIDDQDVPEDQPRHPD